MAGIVVTGAASGIGRACAEALIADGRNVALWDVSPDVTAAADALGAPSAVVDVCNHDQIVAATRPPSQASRHMPSTPRTRPASGTCPQS
jgi:NAD(P)-dependent dehydrogenase (short-subunit alcohol dehydrogenase family)